MISSSVTPASSLARTSLLSSPARKSGEDAAAISGLNDFENYVTLWLQPSPTPASPAPAHPANRALPRPSTLTSTDRTRTDGPHTDRPRTDRVRPPQSESPRRLDASNAAQRPWPGDRLYADRRERAAPEREDAPSSSAGVRSHTPSARSDSPADRRSASEQANPHAPDSGSKQGNVLAARDPIAESHRSLAADADREPAFADKRTDSPGEEIEIRTSRTYSVGELAGAAAGSSSDAPAIEPQSGASATPVMPRALSMATVENTAATGPRSAVPTPLIPDEPAPPSAEAAAGQRVDEDNPAAWHAAAARNEDGSAADASGRVAHSRSGVLSEGPMLSEIHGSLEFVRGSADAVGGEVASRIPPASARGSEPGQPVGMPLIRVSVDPVGASLDASGDPVPSATESASRSTGNASGGANETRSSASPDARRFDLASFPSTATPSKPDLPMDSVQERSPGAAIAPRTAHHTDGADAGTGRLADAGASAMSSAAVLAAATAGGERAFASPFAAGAAKETQTNTSQRLASGDARSRARGVAGDVAPSGHEASRRTTISSGILADGASPSMTGEDSSDASGDAAFGPLRPVSTGMAGFEASQKPHSDVPASRSEGQGNATMASAAAPLRAGVVAGHSRSSSASPSVAEALLAELPPVPGTASGREVPAARSLRVDIPGRSGGEDIRLRFLQRGNASRGGTRSDIDVRIQSASESLVREMRAEIPALLDRLERAGFDAGRATPGQRTDDRGEQRDAPSHRQGNGSSGEDSGQNFTGGHSHGQGAGEQSRQTLPTRATSRRIDASPFAESVAQALAHPAEANGSADS